MASARPDARHLSISQYATGAFQAATPVLGHRGSKSDKSMCGSLRGNVWGSIIVFHQLNPCWFLQPEVVGTYLLGTGTLGWGACCGAELLTPEISLPNFYPPHVGVGPAHLHLHPSHQSGWVWFL